MDANWRKLNATRTAQTNQNEVPPESFCWNVFKNSSRSYQKDMLLVVLADEYCHSEN